MASMSLFALCVLLSVDAPLADGARMPEASSPQRLRMSVTFGLVDSPADTLIADIGDNHMFVAQGRSDCGASRSIAGRIALGRHGTYHVTLVIGDYNGWENSSTQVIALDLVLGKPCGWAICGGLARPYLVTLLRTPAGLSRTRPIMFLPSLQTGAELAHAAERAQRDRSVALDAVARAR